jgi:ribonucleoside-diphosphate reductase alpha chain
MDYAWQLRAHQNKHYAIPMDVFCVANDLDIPSHLKILGACQAHVDASVSKTINCAEDITYVAFKNIYQSVYEGGGKGCTTYRPSDVRGSILSTEESKVNDEAEIILKPRPLALQGSTYKAKWPNDDESYYVTINHSDDGTPFEMFIQSTSSKYTDWTTALSLMISAILRRGGDVSFIAPELKKVVSSHDTGWLGGKYYGSLVALIGETIGEHLNAYDISAFKSVDPVYDSDSPEIETMPKGEICPNCNAPALIPQEGCKKCYNCNYSSCG